MTTDLIAWLRQQLDEDKRVAQMAAGPIGHDWHWDPGAVNWRPGRLRGRHRDDVLRVDIEDRQCGEHIARHDPARVLAEVDAKLRILDAIERMLLDARDAEQEAKMDEVWSLAAYAGSILRLLALPYAGRPGYRDEWRP